jgi:sugar lactone lactonase YvrE
MTSAPSAERVGDSLHALGESPMWSARDRALWYVDLRACALHRFDPASGATLLWKFPELVAGVVLAPHGRLAIAFASRVVLFDPASGTSAPLVTPEEPSLGNRLNETKGDRQGRLWTSSMRDFAAATTGSLYRIERDRQVVRLLGPVTVPNGLAWSPDARTLYFADTPDGRLRAYEFDPATGEIGTMRVLCETGVVPGKPDGAAVDADGCVWSARYGGGCVARITPRGEVDRIVELPVTQVASCAFGGDDLRTLYITTARQRLDEAALAREPLAGALFALRVAVSGLPEVELAL